MLNRDTVKLFEAIQYYIRINQYTIHIQVTIVHNASRYCNYTNKHCDTPAASETACTTPSSFSAVERSTTAPPRRLVALRFGAAAVAGALVWRSFSGELPLLGAPASGTSCTSSPFPTPAPFPFPNKNQFHSHPHRRRLGRRCRSRARQTREEHWRRRRR